MASDDEEEKAGSGTEGEASDDEDSEGSKGKRRKAGQPVKLKIEPTNTSRNLRAIREAEKGPQHPPKRMLYVMSGFGVFFVILALIGVVVYALVASKGSSPSNSTTLAQIAPTMAADAAASARNLDSRDFH